MQSKYRIERDRGTKESERQFAVLREKWPRAFPVDDRDLRPLSSNVAREISAAMGWSLPYTLGVLCGWKLGPAVLCHDQRIGLDGAPTETVDAEAKDLAIKRLAQLAARQAAKKVAKATAPAVKPPPGSTPPAETPPATPGQLRDQVRASLLRRSA